MKSLERGKNTSSLEVTSISQHGFWILLNGTEHFLPFDKFPWFREAKISELTNVELHHQHHLYWPGLDVDLSVDIIQDPDKYKLISE